MHLKQRLHNGRGVVRPSTYFIETTDRVWMKITAVICNKIRRASEFHVTSYRFISSSTLHKLKSILIDFLKQGSSHVKLLHTRVSQKVKGLVLKKKAHLL
jgi:hypothetical protein